MKKSTSKQKKVIVAMSGGVDSSVAAFLLREKGYEVIGATLNIGYGNAPEQAEIICRQLGIPFYLIDATQRFEQSIIRPFIGAYMEGRTPNPCVECNAIIKFPFFLPLLKELGADYLATGHYVRIVEKEGRYLLRRAEFLDKDQSYFMYRLTPEILRYCLFPLGEYAKDQVRAIAKENKLEAATQKDSYDICFIKDGDYRRFIHQFIKDAPTSGDITDKSGHILGRHQGLANYTLGQRRGLNVSLGYPAYVTGMDHDRNRLILGKREDLLSETAHVGALNYLTDETRSEPFSALVQIRYKMKPVTARITPLKDRPGYADIVFYQPVWALTPGQSAVFYDGDVLLGGGVIV